MIFMRIHTGEIFELLSYRQSKTLVQLKGAQGRGIRCVNKDHLGERYEFIGWL